MMFSDENREGFPFLGVVFIGTDIGNRTTYSQRLFCLCNGSAAAVGCCSLNDYCCCCCYCCCLCLLSPECVAEGIQLISLSLCVSFKEDRSGQKGDEKYGYLHKLRMATGQIIWLASYFDVCLFLICEEFLRLSVHVGIAAEAETGDSGENKSRTCESMRRRRTK